MYPATLIESKNHLGNITIEDCVFDTNYIESLLSIDVTSLVYTDLRINSITHTSLAYSQLHFILKNTTFQNIYASSGLIIYTMYEILHNIEINNITINNVNSGGSGAIYISNINSFGKIATSLAFQINNTDIAVKLPTPCVNITKLHSSSSTTGNYIVSIEKMPLVYFSSVTIKNITDGVPNNIDSIIKRFRENSNYLSKTQPSSALANLNCAGAISFLAVSTIDVNHIDISLIFCINNINSETFIIQQSSLNVNMNNIFFHDISASSTGSVCLSVTQCMHLNISSITVRNIANQKGQIIMFNTPYIYIKDIIIDNIFSEYSSALYIQAILGLYIFNISFNQVTSIFGDGACLYVSAMSSNIIMQGLIQNGYFNDCKTLSGLGGGIFLDADSIYNFQAFKMTNITLINCFAVDGSTLYLSEKVVFATGSLFKNISIQNNSADLSIISDNHYAGQLIFLTLIMKNNYAIYAGIKGQYINKGDLLTIQNTTISNGISTDYACMFTSLIIGSNVTMTNLLFHDVLDDTSDNFASAISIDGIYFTISNSTIYNCYNGIIAGTGSTVDVSNSKFYNIYGKFVAASGNAAVLFKGNRVSLIRNALFSLSSSNLTINNNQFVNITQGFISASGGSEIVCNNCTIFNANGTVNSITSSYLYIINSKFYNINGQFISAGGDSQIECINCIVFNITQNLVSMSSGSLNFTNSSFTYIYGRFLLASDALVSLMKCNISYVYGSLISESSGSLIIYQSNISMIDGGLIESTGSTDVNIQYSNITSINGVLFSASSGELYIYSSYFNNISKQFILANGGIAIICDICEIINVQGGLISASSSSLTFTKSKFSHILGRLIAGNGETSFNCTWCDISYIDDTIISMNSGSWIILENCVIYSNTINTYNTALISIISTASMPNIIKNCQFIGNTAKFSDLFNFIDTTVQIYSTTIAYNIALSTDYTGISLLSSILLIDNCYFSNQKANKYGAFLYASRSVVNITSSNFMQGYAIDGGAIYIDTSSLNINSTVFQSNIGSNSGASIYSKNTNITINNSAFRSGFSTLGIEIYMISNELSISNTIFLSSQTLNSGSTSAIYVIDALSIMINNCEFWQFFSNVSGIIAIDTTSIQISYSSFDGISSILTGAVSLVGNTINGNATIIASKFMNNNSTGSGAAIYTSNVGLCIEDSIILNNYAEVDGGGIFFEAPSCASCNFTIFGNTKLQSNHCNRNGGAIKWDNIKPIIADTVRMTNNYAVYGNNIASYPAGLTAVNSRKLATGSSDILLHLIAPGQVFLGSVIIEITDAYGEVINTDSSSTINLQTIPSYPEFLLSGNTSFIASNGVFNITDFIPIGPPGSIQQFIVMSTSISTVGPKNDENAIKNTLLIEIILRNCTYGEQIGINTCLPCKEGKFLIYPNFVCQPCPDGGNCIGGSILLPNPYYWRSSNFSSLVYPCPISYACLGSQNASDFSGTCLDGYTGIKCTQCMAEYTKSTSGSCSKCPNKMINSIIIISSVIIFFIVCIIIVNSSISSAFEPATKYSIHIKILTNYIQLMFLTSQFEMNWPNYLKVLFSTNQTTANSSDAIFSLDCFIGGKTLENPADSYYAKLMLFALLPVVIFIGSEISWIFISLFKMDFNYLKRECTLTMIVIYFLVYPSIVKAMLSDLTCVNIDLLGNYLSANYYIECWDDMHTKYTITLVIPCIIVWIVGMPAFLLIILVKRRRKLHRIHNRIVYGYLFNGYRNSKFYWEFVIIYRKVIMVTISALSSLISVSVQGLTMILILIVFIILQYKLKPFSSVELNLMEAEALCTATLTLYSGVYYLTNQIGDEFKLILFIIIVLGNAYFIVLWIYWMAASVIDMIVGYFPYLRYRLKKGDAIDKEFYVEEIDKKGVEFDANDGSNIYTFTDYPKAPIVTNTARTMNDLYKEALWRGYENKVLNDDDKYQRTGDNKYRDIDQEDPHVRLHQAWIDENKLFGYEEKKILETDTDCLTIE